MCTGQHLSITRPTPTAPLQAYFQCPHEKQRDWDLVPTFLTFFAGLKSVVLLAEQDLYSPEAGNPLEMTGCGMETS